MIYFSSDHHFGHLNIIRYCSRPFASIEEMNEEMVRRWNAVVRPEDTVYYLGDFSLQPGPVEIYAPRLNGTKRLIMGNHDRCHPVNKKRAVAGEQVYRAAGFVSLELNAELEIAGERVLLCHFPYSSAGRYLARWPLL